MPNTLTISFTPASPTPAAGYRVKYWPADNPASITTVSPNPTSSPVLITGLTGTSYVGTIEASCGGGQYSTAVPFTASTPGTTGTITVINSSATATISSFTPAWFYIDLGAIPLPAGDTATGGHSGRLGSFDVAITGTVTSSCLTLSVNGTIVETISVTGPGTFTFNNTGGIAAANNVIIELTNASCI